MKDSLLQPLFEAKKEATVILYSLRAWDFKEGVSPLSRVINRMNRSALVCIESAAFFKYCRENKSLYAYIQTEWPKKTRLLKLSERFKPCGIQVKELFESSLLDCIQKLDLSHAYAVMQYLEGYYLIREAVHKGLLRSEKNIAVAFMLPNDEGKYYCELEKDLENMLKLDFGEALTDVKVAVTFQCFQYTKDLSARPYSARGKCVQAKEISALFEYLSQPFLKDVIHNLGG